LVGPLETEQDPLLPETLREISENKNIVAVGFQKDVRPYFAISDVLVFPSYREGFPNVVMQAGAMNLPSIVTDINGCNEIIINNQNGIIIPAKNDLILQQAMSKIFEDEEFRNLLEKNSRKMIADRFQQKVVLEALLNEYQTLENNVQKFS
jgi:Glycosyltransferase